MKHRGRSSCIRALMCIALLCNIFFLLSACKKPEPPPGTEAAKVTLVVKGTGQDLYSVYDEEQKVKVDFTRTNNELAVSPRVYTLLLNGSRMKVTLREGSSKEVQAGSLLVKGSGIDLYEIFDGNGREKMDFRHTGKEIEIFPGTYQVFLHGVGRTVTVKAGSQETIGTGTLAVAGAGQELYSVYDENEKKKLDFRGVGREIELFPGTYVVLVQDKKYTGTVKAEEKTVIHHEQE